MPARVWGVERRQEFTEFYTSAKDDCLRIVLVSVGDRQLAEDLVAEAFTRAWMSWRTVRDHPWPTPACPPSSTSASSASRSARRTT